MMLNLLENALDLMAFRHRIISSNIAHVNTPQHIRRDVPFFQLMSRIMDTGAAQREVWLDTESSFRPDGNNITLERELAALSENSVLFQAAAQLTSRQLGILRLAVTEGRR